MSKKLKINSKIVIISAIVLSLLLSGLLFFLKFGAMDKKFTDISNRYFRYAVGSSPLSLHYMIKNPDKYMSGPTQTRLQAPTIQSINDIAEKNNFYLNKLDEINPSLLNLDNQIAYHCLYSSLENESNQKSCYLNQKFLSPTQGENALLPLLLAEYSFSSYIDITNYLTLISSVYEYFTGLADWEQHRSDAGYPLCDSEIEGIIAQCKAFCDSGSNMLITSFNEKIENVPYLSTSDRLIYTEQNRRIVLDKIIPAYNSLIKRLSELKGKRTVTQGLCHQKNGKKYYELLAHETTGSALTVPQMYKLIQDNIANYISCAESEMKKVTDIHCLINGVFSQTSPEKILQELKIRILKNFPKPVGIETSTIKEVPTFLENFGSPAFYLLPTIDDFSQNIIYINKKNLDQLTLYPTLAHEGFPGHLYQTTYFYNSHAPLCRYCLSFGGYSEGWATYCENISYDFANKDSHAANVLRYTNKYSLALSTLIDIGVNYYGWTISDAAMWLAKYSATNLSSIKKTFDYVVAEPGIYLKYYIGSLEFERLKEKAQQKLGSKFDLKKYHKFILDMGPCSFEILDSYMNDWLIEELTNK